MKTEPKGTPIFRNLIADYLDISQDAAKSDVHLMNVFEEIDESPKAKTVSKHYTADKSTSNITTGYEPEFSLKGDRYKDNAVTDFITKIGEEELLGITANYYRVSLYKPIADKPNTYYARKFMVEFAVDKLSGKGGEIASVEANMNSQGDVVIGEFNTETLQFTAKDDVAHTIGSLAVTSTAGATVGDTKVTVSPAKATGNSYRYQTAASVALPAYDADCSALTAWDGIAGLTAVTGNKILVVETDSTNKAVAAGITTVTSKAAE